MQAVRPKSRVFLDSATLHPGYIPRPLAGERLGERALVIRFVAGFPLDIAADAGFLVSWRRLIGQHGVYRHAQVGASDGNIIAGPAAVELAAIDQFAVGVKQEEIRGAGGAVGFRYSLGFVVEIRKGIAESFGFLGHVRRAVGGVVGNIVGADGDDGETFSVVVLGELNQPLADVLDERAVVADDHDQQGRGALKVAERNGLAGGWFGQVEIGGGGAEWQHGGGGLRHVRVSFAINWLNETVRQGVELRDGLFEVTAVLEGVAVAGVDEVGQGLETP